jgi:cbb3-type cytochrome oxidase subunit 3
MIQNILKYLGGVEQFGIISLCLFCTVFVGVLFWAFLQTKTHLDYMARVALDPEADKTQTGETPHD